ncbi:MAG: threonine--tRNA ligase [Candidatus Zixiibacteriota bacterium]
MESIASGQVQITLPDKNRKAFPKGTTPREVAEDLGQELSKAALAAEYEGELVDLSYPLDADGEIKILTFESEEGREIYWHSTAHVMASAVVELYPETKVAIGPATAEGFYYDFDRPQPFTPEDLEKIEEKMRQILDGGHPFVRKEVSRQEATDYFRERGEIYKVEILSELPPEETVSLYSHGDFVDLCRGPHLPSTDKIGAFKLLKVAGAYWRGSEKNKMLQRIYGVSFPRQEQLEEYLGRLEEAKKRDHRLLGPKLDLFSIHEAAGAGLVMWHPKGALVRNLIEEHWKREHFRGGYELVYSPHIAKIDLWKTSGHVDFYSENMYSPMDIEGTQYLIKPMNCPFHILIYKSKVRSYRELPLRWAELGTVYRYERSGVLHGLFRVRGFTQDDAHIFCRPDQVKEEIERVFNFSIKLLGDFGFDKLLCLLSTRPEKFVGEDKSWEMATEALRETLEKSSLRYKIDEGAGVFYGPKIDLDIEDSLGRMWQLTTIQFDFNLPERFDLRYTDSDGQQKTPFMIHRALLGSLERFFGILIEHYSGALPFWLFPVQVVVISITDQQEPYAREVREQLLQAGLRAELDARSEKVGYKIREAEEQKIPYMLIIGKKEVENQNVAVRVHGKGDLGARGLEELINNLKEVQEKKVGY